MYTLQVQLCFVVIATFSTTFRAEANFLQTLEQKFHKVENYARHELNEVVDHVDRVETMPWKTLNSAVRHMSIKAPMSVISAEANSRIGQTKTGKRPSILADGFKWKSCGPADQLVEVRNITIKPTPLYFPGDLTFGFDIIFHDDIPQTAQISAALKLQYQSSGSWINIPCIGQIGSCTYNDVCSLSQAIQCPAELKQQGIPCTCPYNKGEYKLSSYTVEIDASVFLTGNYQSQVVFTDATRGQIACYQVWFTVG